jgi:hypothetical protein
MRMDYWNHKTDTHQRPWRRGVALLTVLLLLTLLIAVVGEMVSVSGTEAILATRQANDLSHELALASAIDLVSGLLQTDLNARSRVNRGEAVPLNVPLPGCSVQALIRSDGAKFDVAAFAEAKQATLLADKIRSVGRRKGIAAVAVTLRPIQQTLPGSRPYLWFDQLLEQPDPLAIFHWPGDPRPGDRWSDWITVFGSGQVDLQASDEPVLTAMLDDIQEGLGRQILENRPQDPANANDGVETALQGIEQQAVRDAARARLAWGLNRYSLQAVTAIGTDVRVSYVVLTIPDAQAKDNKTQPRVLLRRQIRW